MTTVLPFHSSTHIQFTSKPITKDKATTLSLINGQLTTNSNATESSRNLAVLPSNSSTSGINAGTMAPVPLGSRQQQQQLQQQSPAQHLQEDNLGSQDQAPGDDDDGDEILIESYATRSAKSGSKNNDSLTKSGKNVKGLVAGVQGLSVGSSSSLTVKTGTEIEPEQEKDVDDSVKGADNLGEMETAQGEIEAEPVRLFVGQVPESMVEPHLTELFAGIDVEVVDIAIIRDKHTSRHRHCAFITVPSREQANRAVEEFHNKKYLESMSNPMQVKEANQPKPKQSFSSANSGLYGGFGAIPMNMNMFGMGMGMGMGMGLNTLNNLNTLNPLALNSLNNLGNLGLNPAMMKQLYKMQPGVGMGVLGGLNGINVPSAVSTPTASTSASYMPMFGSYMPAQMQQGKTTPMIGQYGSMAPAMSPMSMNMNGMGVGVNNVYGASPYGPANMYTTGYMTSQPSTAVAGYGIPTQVHSHSQSPINQNTVQQGSQVQSPLGQTHNTPKSDPQYSSSGAATGSGNLGVSSTAYGSSYSWPTTSWNEAANTNSNSQYIGVSGVYPIYSTDAMAEGYGRVGATGRSMVPSMNNSYQTSSELGNELGNMNIASTSSTLSQQQAHQHVQHATDRSHSLVSSEHGSLLPTHANNSGDDHEQTNTDVTPGIGSAGGYAHINQQAKVVGLAQSTNQGLGYSDMYNSYNASLYFGNVNPQVATPTAADVYSNAYNFGRNMVATDDSASKLKSTTYVEGPIGANLFVNNLPDEVTDEDLLSLFACHGNILSYKVFIDKFTHKSKGFGFVSFGSVHEAQEAIREKNGFEIQKDRRLIVELKRAKRTKFPDFF